MYELVERKLNNKDVRLLKLRVRGYEKQIHPLYRVVLVSGLYGYGATGLEPVIFQLIYSQDNRKRV
jgi:hypothetical protein